MRLSGEQVDRHQGIAVEPTTCAPNAFNKGVAI
jgi:galactose mutarotase-like enzyme